MADDENCGKSSSFLIDLLWGCSPLSKNADDRLSVDEVVDASSEGNNQYVLFIPMYKSVDQGFYSARVPASKNVDPLGGERVVVSDAVPSGALSTHKRELLDSVIDRVMDVTYEMIANDREGFAGRLENACENGRVVPEGVDIVGEEFIEFSTTKGEYTATFKFYVEG